MGTAYNDPSISCTQTPPRPTIALLPYFDLFEDFHDRVGISIESYRDEYTGGWLFNYIDALRLAGVRTVVFYVSARVITPLRFTHAPTGATVCILPAPAIYRACLALRQWRGRRETRKIADDVQHRHLPLTRLNVVLRGMGEGLQSYLATPYGLLARELRGEGCAAILCQEYENPRFDACTLLGWVMRLPTFATFQGGDHQRHRLDRYIRPLAIRLCTKLIVPAQSEVRRLRTQYGVPDRKIAYICNPIDPAWQAMDRTEARMALGIPDRARVVAWHGRVVMSVKGLDILLDAWDHLCRERGERELLLLLIGTGSDAEKLVERIAALPRRNVLWVNEYVRDRARIRCYLSASDVYAFPSRREGFPMAPIEAMACGVPVVAADAHGIPDIFAGGEASGGIVVPRGDATALALALGRLLDDETWAQEMGRRARHRVEAAFSLQSVGDQLRALLVAQVDR